MDLAEVHMASPVVSLTLSVEALLSKEIGEISLCTRCIARDLWGGVVTLVSLVPP